MNTYILHTMIIMLQIKLEIALFSKSNHFNAAAIIKISP